MGFNGVSVKKGLDAIYSVYNKLKQKYGSEYIQITAGLKSWFKSLNDSHPAKDHKHYSHADARGIYFPSDISWPGGGGPRYEVLHPQTGKPVRVPKRGWRFSDPKKMHKLVNEDRVHFGNDEQTVPCLKSYLRDKEYQAPYSIFYKDGRGATKRLRKLMGGDYFKYPKDEFVLQEIVEMVTSCDDIILDFFAGSGTTGQSVMTQNVMDYGNRRYILVQLPEPLDPAHRAQKDATRFCDELGKPYNIAEITKERLRRAVKKIKDDHPIFSGDLGFRVFKLDTSNIYVWDPDPDDLEGTLIRSVDSIKSDRSEDDIIYELLLKLGLDLCTPIEKKLITGRSVAFVGDGRLIICLAKQIGRSDVEELALGISAWFQKITPTNNTTVVFRDSAFEDDVTKANLSAILNQHGLSDLRSL